MIKVNNNLIPWGKGLTVEKLLKENNFLIHLSIVKINGQLINKKSFAIQIITDSDDLKIIHLTAGG
ncbi:MAG: sulfur carrier protein ThiS [Candidatus Tenebribacter burtonii]|jgi:thiamine biosynthesis protein ThiS|nr:sulfur carrier protein ThiS [Candidatus Tenebribacter burtonii]